MTYHVKTAGNFLPEVCMYGLYLTVFEIPDLKKLMKASVENASCNPCK